MLCKVEKKKKSHANQTEPESIGMIHLDNLLGLMCGKGWSLVLYDLGLALKLNSKCEKAKLSKKFIKSTSDICNGQKFAHEKYT